MLPPMQRDICGTSPNVRAWASVPPAMAMAYETLIGTRVAVRSWALREADLSPSCKKLKLWQEVDYSAFNRPGGRKRVVTQIETNIDLSPRRVTIDTDAGRAEVRFMRHAIAVRLVDTTRITQQHKDVAIVLPDNAPALLAFYIKLLDASGRLPGRFEAYLPGTLGTITYALERICEGWLTSLGEIVSVNAEGWIETILVAGNIRIVRVNSPVPRWRHLKDPGRKLTSKVRLWGPAREIESRFDGQRCWARLSHIAKPRAALLFIGGSGAHDRLGSSGAIDLGYGDLAELLTAGGVQCLLFDKPGAGRTRVHPALAQPSFHRTIALAEHWLEELAAINPIDIPLFIAGHSEGGQVAAVLAARRRDLAGICLLATAARPIDEILIDQMCLEADDLGIDAETRVKKADDLRDFFTWLRTADRSEAPPERHQLMAPFVDWYAEMIETRLDQTLSHVRVPVAIVQGERDIQVPPEEAERLAALARASGLRVTVKMFAELDHLFKRGMVTTHIRAYGDRRRRFAREVAEWLLSWISNVLTTVGQQERASDK